MRGGGGRGSKDPRPLPRRQAQSSKGYKGDNGFLTIYIHATHAVIAGGKLQGACIHVGVDRVGMRKVKEFEARGSLTMEVVVA